MLCACIRILTRSKPGCVKVEDRDEDMKDLLVRFREEAIVVKQKLKEESLDDEVVRVDAVVANVTLELPGFELADEVASTLPHIDHGLLGTMVRTWACML